MLLLLLVVEVGVVVVDVVEVLIGVVVAVVSPCQGSPIQR